MMPTIITTNQYIIKLYMIMIIEMEIVSFSLPQSVMEKCSVDLTFEFVKKNLQFKQPAPQTKLNSGLSLSEKQRRNPSRSGPPPVYQEFSTCHYWPVKNAIVDLPLKIKGNQKPSSGNFLCPQGTQNKDIGDALQTFLTVRLCLFK